MRQLPTEIRCRILNCLVEGMGMRATSRLCDVSINTVTGLLEDAGTACAEYQDAVFRGLPCKMLQIDELWSFCYARAKNVKDAKAAPEGAGDSWVWIAIDRDSRLVPCWHVGKREFADAAALVDNLASRLAHRCQLTTDGHNAYLSAVENAFGDAIDYAMLVKVFGGASDPTAPATRYLPPKYLGARKTAITGNPDMSKVSTSHVEAQNLTIRMNNKRFSRLTNAHSKKLANHKHSLALHFMHRNFLKIHPSLRVTPAMEAGLSTHVWEWSEVVDLINTQHAKRKAEWVA